MTTIIDNNTTLIFREEKDALILYKNHFLKLVPQQIYHVVIRDGEEERLIFCEFSMNEAFQEIIDRC